MSSDSIRDAHARERFTRSTALSLSRSSAAAGVPIVFATTVRVLYHTYLLLQPFSGSFIWQQQNERRQEKHIINPHVVHARLARSQPAGAYLHIFLACEPSLIHVRLTLHASFCEAFVIIFSYLVLRKEEAPVNFQSSAGCLVANNDNYCTFFSPRHETFCSFVVDSLRVHTPPTFSLPYCTVRQSPTEELN